MLLLIVGGVCLWMYIGNKKAQLRVVTASSLRHGVEVIGAVHRLRRILEGISAMTFAICSSMRQPLPTRPFSCADDMAFGRHFKCEVDEQTQLAIDITHCPPQCLRTHFRVDSIMLLECSCRQRRTSATDIDVIA